MSDRPTQPLKELFAANHTIRNREKLACMTCLDRAVTACRNIAREKNRKEMPGKAATALECAEAVRALMAEVV